MATSWLRVVAGASVGGLLLGFVACGSGSDGGAQNADKGDFILKYEQPKPEDAHVAQVVRSSGDVEDAVDGLNDQYALPEDIHIVFAADDPDQSGPYFDPETNTITLMYPSLTEDRQIFADHGYDDPSMADEAVMSDVLFTLYHELGHALIANFDLPVTGHEEDAVDALSAVILDDTYDNGQQILLTNADWFKALAEANGGQHDFSDYADQHSLDEQRFVTLICLAYGSDPDTYKDFVNSDELPEDRADGCEAEYQQADDAWTKLLAPWTKK